MRRRWSSNNAAQFSFARSFLVAPFRWTTNKCTVVSKWEQQGSRQRGSAEIALAAPFWAPWYAASPFATCQPTACAPTAMHTQASPPDRVAVCRQTFPIRLWLGTPRKLDYNKATLGRGAEEEEGGKAARTSSRNTASSIAPPFGKVMLVPTCVRASSRDSCQT